MKYSQRKEFSPSTKMTKKMRRKKSLVFSKKWKYDCQLNIVYYYARVVVFYFYFFKVLLYKRKSNEF